MLYAGDLPWWEVYLAKVKAQGFAGELWTGSLSARGKFKHLLNYVPTNMAVTTLPKRGHTVGHGGNSGFQAVGLAYLFGAIEINLLGFDMKRTMSKSHCHGDHPKPLSSRGNYRVWCERFGLLAAALEKEGVRVRNFTRSTNLKCFPFAALEDLQDERVAA